ncbi:acyl-CoA dehydrogenase family protein [Halomonas sp. Bachu 37]|uniref:acyl-CoA dehydrogenase family protein n=1 Tax=Halomonas kashgarensis TaxID=3084920 RepID=UPI0032170285
MDFQVTEEQRMIADTVDEALTELCQSETLREQIEQHNMFDAGRWQALSDLGLPSALLPENAGGVGLDDVAFCAIARAAGAALLPEPLIESAGVALPLLVEMRDSAVDKVSLPQDFDMSVTELTKGMGHAVLVHPLRPFAPHADTACQIIVAEDNVLWVGKPENFTLKAHETIDPLTTLFSVNPHDATRVPLSEEGLAALAKAIDRATLFTAAQLAGIASAAQQLAVTYATERQQFGRSIGANQAIKHLLAEVEVEAAFLAPVIIAAAALLPRQNVLGRGHLANARLRAAWVAGMACQSAVQVHGAMGYAWETDVHLLLKRAMVLSTQWGDDERLFNHAADRTFDAGQMPGPGTLFEAAI